MSAHPDEQTLQEWLETGRPGRVTRHLDECESCLDRLDALSDLGEIRHELSDVSRPPDDLHQRTTGSVQGRIAAEEAALAVVELFTLPWRTAAAILGEPARPVDRRRSPGHHSDDDGEQGHE